MSDGIYWSANDPRAGAVAAGFRAARDRMVDAESQDDISRAADDWWHAVDRLPPTARQPERVLGIAVAAARGRGVELPVMQGLTTTIGATAVTEAKEKSYLEQAEEWYNKTPSPIQDAKAAAAAALARAERDTIIGAGLFAAVLLGVTYLVISSGTAKTAIRETGKTVRTVVK